MGDTINVEKYRENIITRIRALRSMIQYEKAEGIHTLHNCECSREYARGNNCFLCLQEEKDRSEKEFKDFLKDKDIYFDCVGECPLCGSLDLEYNDSKNNGEFVYHHITCNDCGSEGEEIDTITYNSTKVKE